MLFVVVGDTLKKNLLNKEEKHGMKRSLSFALAILLALTVFTCGAAADSGAEDIILLFTNDVHCGIDEDIGYAGLAAYVEATREKTPYVTLIDCGDAIQGDVIGTVSDGEYIVDIMNELGYDLAILGNHEFDYGMEQLAYLLDKAEARYLGANIVYTGEGESVLPALEPYAILSYGDTDVAFVGLTTPWSTSSSTPTFFMDEEGNFVYDFTAGEDGQELYDLTQQCVNQCREQGAEYVILLAHLGDTEESGPYSSIEVIQNTTGVDAVLDGHAHSVLPCEIVQDAEGKDVLLVSTGTKLSNIGQVVITASGNITAGLISGYDQKDPETEAYVASVQALYEETVNQVVAHSDVALSISDGAGVRMVRNRETAIGNFCADAYRTATGADIAVVNGGGIRADLPAGDITYADIIAVHPFGNTLCMVEATGQEILDCLEIGCMHTESEYAADGQALGEDGTFFSVSGMRYTVDTSIPTSVELDDNGMFVAVTGERRVTDVEVLDADTGEYVPLDPEETYTFACHNYLLKEGGGGCNMFADNTFLIDEAMLDYEVLINYLTETLGGELSGYAATEGRITVK